MTFHQPPLHGGRLSAAARHWGIPRSQWLDLSTGINPVAWPVPALPAEVWQRLPEDDDGLEAILKAWVGASESSVCVPLAGSQAAIQALPPLRARCRVGIPVPGYEEHAYSWRQTGHEVIPVPLTRIEEGDDWLNALDVLVWINPNNPAATTVSAHRLLAWHQKLQARQGWLVVDEAFMNADEEQSLAAQTGVPGLVVLRSLGKFFGLAGIRAGAAFTDAAMADELQRVLGPWSVSGPARAITALAVADKSWQRATIARLQRDTEALKQVLDRHGLIGSVGTPLFRYLPHAQAQAVADALASQGVLVRRFDNPPALRFGLPGSPHDWQRLETALANLIDR